MSTAKGGFSNLEIRASRIAARKLLYSFSTPFGCPVPQQQPNRAVPKTNGFGVESESRERTKKKETQRIQSKLGPKAAADRRKAVSDGGTEMGNQTKISCRGDRSIGQHQQKTPTRYNL